MNLVPTVSISVLSLFRKEVGGVKEAVKEVGGQAVGELAWEGERERRQVYWTNRAGCHLRNNENGCQIHER